jgi:hypothetical protein
MSDPTTTDDELAAQLRAWADDLAGRIPPTEAPTSAPTRATAGRGARRRPTRVLALAAAVLVLLALAAAVVARSDGDTADVRTATTTTPATITTTTPAEPDLPLLETTWWLERVEVDGEEPVVAPDRSLTMVLTEGEYCASPDDCPHPDAFMLGSDGCNGYWATVTLGDGRLTARPFGGRTLMACASEVSRVGALVRPIEDGTSTYEIHGDVLVLRFGSRTTYRFRADADPSAPVPKGHSVFVDRGDEPAHRWSWHRGIQQGRDGITISARASEETQENGASVQYPSGSPPGTMVATISIDPPLMLGLVDGRATTVTYERGDVVVEMPTRALEGEGVRAFTGGVPDAAGGWRLTATAADGSVVAVEDALP